MSAVVTIAERKAREARRRADAAEAVIADLGRFAGGRGRFIVFGSAARRSMRHDSDFDVLIDFPPDLEFDAWTAVEESCAAHGLVPDIHSTATSRTAFVERVLRDALVIS